jgi:hypothetical protein
MSIRLSQESYEALQEVATSRGTRLNKAVEDSIEVMAATVRRERLRVAFSNLAEAEHSADFAFEAQSEVVLDQHP